MRAQSAVLALYPFHEYRKIVLDSERLSATFEITFLGSLPWLLTYLRLLLLRRIIYFHSSVLFASSLFLIDRCCLQDAL